MRLPQYALIALFFLLSVTACSYDSKDSTQSAAPPPTAAKQETIAPIPTAMDTFRALAPPDGLKFTPLFNENVGDTNTRFKRLEDAVQTIRNDVDTLAPTMVRMVAIEKDIKGLVAQLQTITDQGQPASQTSSPSDKKPSNLPPVFKDADKPITGASSITGGTAEIPGGENTKDSDVFSSLVTPEAASKGELPPEGAASPNSGANAPKQIPDEGASAPSLVTPEAASKGELPPEGAASPNSKAPGLAPQGLNLKGTPHADAGGVPAPIAGDVTNMHIDDHPEKTQLTLDVTGDAPAKASLTNDGKMLVIDLARFNWRGKDTWEANHQKRIAGGYVKDGKLYVNLKQSSGFGQKILPPSGDAKNYRIVIDLFDKKAQKKAAAPPAIGPAAQPAPATPPPEEDFP